MRLKSSSPLPQFQGITSILTNFNSGRDIDFIPLMFYIIVCILFFYYITILIIKSIESSLMIHVLKLNATLFQHNFLSSFLCLSFFNQTNINPSIPFLDPIIITRFISFSRHVTHHCSIKLFHHL